MVKVVITIHYIMAEANRIGKLRLAGNEKEAQEATKTLEELIKSADSVSLGMTNAQLCDSCNKNHE